MKNALLVILCLFITSSFLAQEAQSVKKRVLIYTKNGEGFVHKNIPSSIKALKEICKQEGIIADSSDTPSLFTTENLAKYDALIFSNANNDVFDNESQKKAFQDFIKNGGGFMGIHSSNAVERNWPWYWAMIGGKFVRHAPHQEFDVVVTDASHPSTNFLDKRWTISDECYYSNHLNPSIHVLLSADLNTVEDKQKSTYPSDIFGNYFPLCWTNNFEGARQWYTAIGHDAKAYNDPTFRKHLRGGIVWVLAIED